MIARPSWFWSSLFSSLTVNAVLFVSGACYLYSQTPIWLPGWPQGSSAAPAEDNPVFVPPIADTLLGESTGKGTATDAAPGDAPMEARLGPQDQSFLSRDPEGPGRVGDPPSMSTQIPGENGNGGSGQPATFGVAMAQADQAEPVFARQSQASSPPAEQPQSKQLPALQSTPSPAQPPKQSAPAIDDAGSAPKPIVESDDPKEADTTPTQPPTSQPSVDVKSAIASIAEETPPAPPNTSTETPQRPTDPAQNNFAQIDRPQPKPAPAKPAPQGTQSLSAGGGKPGPKQAAADPAPQSDSESDPFASKGVVKFRQGSTQVQFGRKHKLVRPQLGLAGQTALLQLQQPVVLVLSLSLDETGKITHVGILQSSGSKDIDQACKVAAYQWWLEPSKDKNGKPVKDVIPFAILFS